MVRAILWLFLFPEKKVKTVDEVIKDYLKNNMKGMNYVGAGATYIEEFWALEQGSLSLLRSDNIWVCIKLCLQHLCSAVHQWQSATSLSCHDGSSLIVDYFAKQNGHLLHLSVKNPTFFSLPHNFLSRQVCQETLQSLSRR